MALRAALRQARGALTGAACGARAASSTPHQTAAAAAAVSRAPVAAEAASASGKLFHGFHPEHFAEAPAVPLALGLLGALPFVAMSAPMFTLLQANFELPEALVARRGTLHAGYGATILSFLGGMHWGFAAAGCSAAAGAAGAAAAAAPLRFAWSVAPSLVAWPALMLPAPAALVTLAGGLAAGVALSVDSALAAKALMPRWMMPLRFLLTFTAVGGLLASVPAAQEEERAAEAEAAMRRLLVDEPALKAHLEARERSLADAKADASALRAELETAAMKVEVSAAAAAAARTAEGEARRQLAAAAGTGGSVEGSGAGSVEEAAAVSGGGGNNN